MFVRGLKSFTFLSRGLSSPLLLINNSNLRTKGLILVLWILNWFALVVDIVGEASGSEQC